MEFQQRISGISKERPPIAVLLHGCANVGVKLTVQDESIIGSMAAISISSVTFDTDELINDIRVKAGVL